MPEIPFCSGGYKLETPNASPMICRNFYPERVEKGARAGQFRLRSIPGLAFFASLPGGGPIRALWSNATRCFAVSGGGLYEVFYNGTSTFYGALANGTNPAIIQSNGNQLAIASAGQAYVVPNSQAVKVDATGAILPAKIPPAAGLEVVSIVDTTGALVPAATMAFIDQYFIAAAPNLKQIMISNLGNGAIWDPANTAQKEAYSDNISRVWVDQPGGEYVWLFGNETIEVWTDTGGLFPFGRVPGMVFPFGCDSAWSLAGAEGLKAWIWRGIIYGCQGVQPPTRISDSGIEEAIKTYSEFDRLNAEAFAWIDGAHVFYAISFPQAGKTWVYDAGTTEWHERAYYFNGQYGRYRPRVYTKAFGRHLVGDYATGTIYQMDPTVCVDAPPIAAPTGPGVPLRRERVSTYFSDSMKNDRYNRFTLDLDTGVGLEVGPTAVGNNPQVILRYSNDRGKNWSMERQATMGQVGKDSTRVFWPQVGSSRIGWTANVIVTDPVTVSINAAYLDIGPGLSPGNRPTS